MLQDMFETYDGFKNKRCTNYEATLEALLIAYDDFADPFRSSSLLTELPFALRQSVQDLLYALSFSKSLQL
jgi:hypothetical protein